MYCSSCGGANADGARFCSACGSGLAAPAPPMAAVAMVPSVPVPVHIVRVVPCPNCGSVEPPAGYFSRPAHIALLVVAMTMYFFPGLIYFMSRKDRLVCRNCGHWRASGAALTGVQRVLARRVASDDEPSAAVAGEVLLPERSEMAERVLEGARRSKRSATFWGVVSASAVGIGIGTGGLGFVLAGGVAAAIAAWRLARGGALERVGETKRQSHIAMRILQLARLRHGVLTVSEVASTLNMPMPEAERALDGMVDGLHVDMEVNDDGRVRYLFPELASRELPESAP